MDVRDFKYEGYYDIVCASPDCKELSNARSWSAGNVEFADSVAKACIDIILHYVSLGATGILENPKGGYVRKSVWAEICVTTVSLEARKTVSPGDWVTCFFVVLDCVSPFFLQFFFRFAFSSP